MISRKLMVPTAIIVILLFTVGIGYAYTAIVLNDDNDSTPEFITVRATDTSSQPSYSDAFDGKVDFDTVTTYEAPNTYVTYTLSKSQFALLDGKKASDNTAITALDTDYVGKKLGNTLLINIDRTAGITGDNAKFTIDMTNVSGTMDTDYKYMVGYKFADDVAGLATATEYFKVYTPGAINKLIDPTNGSDTPKKFSASTTVVAVNLYLTGTNNTYAPQKVLYSMSPDLDMPLEDVTFSFKATTASTVTEFGLVINKTGTGSYALGGNNTLQTTYYEGDEVTITFTGTVSVLKKNGVSVIGDLDENAYTFTFGTSDVIIDVTVNTAP